MLLAEEKVKEVKPQEEPVLLKESQAKSPKGLGWMWFLIVIMGGLFLILKPIHQVATVGTLKARQFARLELEIPGTLKEVVSRKGESVKAGDVLARFINPELSQEIFLKNKALEIAQDELAGLQNKEAILRVRLEKEAILLENGAMSKAEFQEFEHEHYLAEKQIDIKLKVIEKIKSEIVFLEQNLSKLELKASFPGIVLEDPIQNLGGHFKEGDTAFLLADPLSFYLEVAIRENRIGKIHIGDPAIIRFDSDPIRTYRGEVAQIGIRTNKQVEKVFKVRHVVMCEIRLRSIPENLRYGMQAKVVVTSAAGKGGKWSSWIKIKKKESKIDGIFKP